MTGSASPPPIRYRTRTLKSEGRLERLIEERKPDHVTYAGWEAIDHAERTAGEPHGRPRVKHTTYDDLLAAAGKERAQLRR